MKVRSGLRRPWRAPAALGLIVGVFLWPVDPVDAQTRVRLGGQGRPSVVAEVLTESFERSAEALEFQIAVVVPAGHHGYLDKGDDGFFIPFSFSFPSLEEAGVGVEVTSTPPGVRDDGVRAQVLRGRASFAFRMVPAPKAPVEVTADLRYQICNDVTNICYPPSTLRIHVAVDRGSH